MSTIQPDEFRVRRKHAWGYFQVHAAQRLTAFHFYLILASVLATALFAMLQHLDTDPLLPVAPGLLLAFFSFLFARLDDRTRELIRNGEDALRHLERHWQSSHADKALPIEAVFCRDGAFVERQRLRRTFLAIHKNHLSYRDCFRFAFLSLGLLGGGAALIVLTLYVMTSRA